MNILIVYNLLGVFITYDSCLRLHVVLCALHELNYNLKVVILAIVIWFNDCSELVSNRFRLGLTNIYSIDEYKIQSLLFYLKYFILYELMHNLTPSFAEEQILFSSLK